jgi:ABC-type lipoprotein release transport system permease subunit
VRPWRFLLQSLRYYWRTHLAVVLGVATAVAVLAGALLVGESVRGSLRDLVLDRLGRTDELVASPRFFTETLAAAVATDPAFPESFDRAAPLIVARGMVTNQDNGRRAGNVAIYGVDDRFWHFHGVDRAGPPDRAAFASVALARQLQAEPRHGLLIRAQRVTDVPLESLHGQKEDLGRTLRVELEAILPRQQLGEFSLDPSQSDVHALFVPLSRLQIELEADGRINTLLVSRRRGSVPDNSLSELVKRHATLDDAGITVTPVEPRRTVVIASSAGLLEDADAARAQEAVAQAGLGAQPVFTYLANSIRVDGRELPYSLVSALDLASLAPEARVDSIVLTDWAARDLGARVGDSLDMTFYVWEEPGRLVTRTVSGFVVAAVVPLSSGGRDLAPVFPGITDSPTLDDWDPPFPVDLSKVRPVDEAFWAAHRTTPKAYISLAAGQGLWRSRYGALTSLRVGVPAGESVASVQDRLTAALRQTIDPLAAGMAVRDVRASGLEASRGATDFGEYFVYFSFFLVVSALLLASLFFKLGVEGRVREVGLLRAVGFGPAAVRRQFLIEGLLLAAAGTALGLVAAVGYAALLMYGLRTWWVDAVGTTSLTLHVTPMPLAAGAVGGILAAAICIWWTLRSLDRISERSLLMGEIDAPSAGAVAPSPVTAIAGAVLAVIAIALLAAGAGGWLAPVAAFFGAGLLLMVSVFLLLLWRLRAPAKGNRTRGALALPRLGTSYARYRPGRSVLSAAVIASATFILIAVGAFRKDGPAATDDRASGTGGYSVIVDTLLPIVHDPNTPEGRDALNLSTLPDGVRIEPFRVLPGDDASCLNLYAPKQPRVIAAREAFMREARFTFSGSLASTEAERANPWLLLERTFEDGAVPVIADANSMTYVLHRGLGDDIVIDAGGRPLRLRLVAALRDSVLQGELVMASSRFVPLFPGVQGYQRLLVQSEGAAGELVDEIEDALANAGADAQPAAERLASFHRVENTYLSTFQTLGGLGLLLGTVGLGAVLMRNALERRRELALLGAVGYRRSHVLTIVLAENVLLLAAGIGTGALAAGLAIVPAIMERGGRIPLTTGGALLFGAIIAAGLLSSLVATRAATRGSLLTSLRSE